MSNTVYDASLEAEMEERNKVEIIRDNSQSIQIGDKLLGKINSYKFTILIRDKASLEGELSREEMDLVYRLYSTEGSNLTQRTVSRYFPNFTFQDFKRILRAFNVTKASSPFAPHVLEEKSTDELIQLTFQSKENDYLRKLEQDRNKLNETKLKEVLKENYELKQNIRSGKHLIESLELTNEKYEIVKNKNNKNTVLIYLSDMHIGAYNSNEGVYENPYDEQEVVKRLNKVFNRISNIKEIDQLVIFNLGDAIDGYNSKTTRESSSHILPQNMSNKEQCQVYIRVMTNFFNNIQNTIKYNELKFYSVGHSNHGGDFEYSINIALSHILDSKGISSVISSKPLDFFKLGNKTIVYGHGKDNSDQFKNFPLTVNEKLENYMNEYLYMNDIHGEVLVVKGDLHQSATTRGKRFIYKSVSSLFGSSNWIHANFGFTPWGCDYSIIDYEGNIVDGLIN